MTSIDTVVTSWRASESDRMVRKVCCSNISILTMDVKQMPPIHTFPFPFHYSWATCEQKLTKTRGNSQWNSWTYKSWTFLETTEREDTREKTCECLQYSLSHERCCSAAKWQVATILQFTEQSDYSCDGCHHEQSHPKLSQSHQLETRWTSI